MGPPKTVFVEMTWVQTGSGAVPDHCRGASQTGFVSESTLGVSLLWYVSGDTGV